MADHEGDEVRDRSIPGELFRPTEARRATSPAAIDLAEALGGLDRATRDFTRRLGEGQREVELARMAGERAIREAAAADPEEADEVGFEVEEIAVELEAEAEIEFEVEPKVEIDPVEAIEPLPDAPSAVAEREQLAREAFEKRMREAEVEARAYLESAKRRADTIVKSMVGAVEHEAAQARRDAEENIKARWQQVEVEASHHVDSARRVAGEMVAEQQTRISKLSDGISGRAEALTAGMDDADRVRAQFDAFVRALAVTADQIAREPSRGTVAGRITELREQSLPSAMAA